MATNLLMSRRNKSKKRQALEELPFLRYSSRSQKANSQMPSFYTQHPISPLPRVNTLTNTYAPAFKKF